MGAFNAMIVEVALAKGSLGLSGGLMGSGEIRMTIHIAFIAAIADDQKGFTALGELSPFACPHGLVVGFTVGGLGGDAGGYLSLIGFFNIPVYTNIL
jgi:hypothetical protein